MFFIVSPTWGRFPFWLIFFNWVAVSTKRLAISKVHTDKLTVLKHTLKSSKGSKLSSVKSGNLPFSSQNVVSKAKQSTGPVGSSPVANSRHTWVCSVCHAQVCCQTQGGLSCSKKHHMKSRHPEFNLKLIMHQRRPTVVVASCEIPLTERGWTCPLCPKGLPCLPNQDRLRAIKEHCKEPPR